MQIGLVSIILILIKVQLFSYLALFEPITIRVINKTLLIMKLFLGSYKMKQTTGRRDCNRNICLNQTVYTMVMHVTERSRKLIRDVRLRGGLDFRW